MNRAYVALLVLVAVTAIALGHMLSVWSDLPERIPTHFSGGQPDAWSDKEGFAWTWGITLLVTALMLGGTGWLMGKLDSRWVSLPHREHWLAPGQRDATLLDLRFRVWWLGVMTMLLLLDLQIQMFAVARSESEDLTHFDITMTVYLLATLAWTVALLVRYGRRPAGPPAA